MQDIFGQYLFGGIDNVGRVWIIWIGTTALARKIPLVVSYFGQGFYLGEHGIVSEAFIYE